jgi:hypothetical protein
MPGVSRPQPVSRSTSTKINEILFLFIVFTSINLEAGSFQDPQILLVGLPAEKADPLVSRRGPEGCSVSLPIHPNAVAVLLAGHVNPLPVSDASIILVMTKKEIACRRT